MVLAEVADLQVSGKEEDVLAGSLSEGKQVTEPRKTTCCCGDRNQRTGNQVTSRAYSPRQLLCSGWSVSPVRLSDSADRRQLSHQKFEDG